MRMYDVFLSYSQDNIDRARWFVELMKTRGWTVFWDQTSIPGGIDFATFIEEKLNESVCILVLWTAESVASESVAREAGVGLERNCLCG